IVHDQNLESLTRLAGVEFQSALGDLVIALLRGVARLALVEGGEVDACCRRHVARACDGDLNAASALADLKVVAAELHGRSLESRDGRELAEEAVLLFAGA